MEPNRNHEAREASHPISGDLALAFDVSEFAEA
jgi:hypothetical protein